MSWVRQPPLTLRSTTRGNRLLSPLRFSSQHRLLLLKHSRLFFIPADSADSLNLDESLKAGNDAQQPTDHSAVRTKSKG